MELRPYQIEAKQAVLEEYGKGRRSTLLVLPTGTGKTVVFSSVLDEQLKTGGRGLILAHREELLAQAQDKLFQTTGRSSALEKGDSTAANGGEQVVVASVQTLCRPERLLRFGKEGFTDIVVDEAHHCVSESYQRILHYFDRARVLGVTATPDRGDHRNLGGIFESKAFEYPISSAIRDGYLCPITARMIPIEIKIEGDSRAGDYKAEDIGKALDPYLESIADEMARNLEGRKTVVFLPLVKTAVRFSEMLNERGISSAEIDGESPDRERILSDFNDNRYQVLCNSMLLTEGWDQPDVSCIVVLRPTKVRALYCQMVGRGTRICPGKKDLLLLDFLYLTERHDLCTPASILCPDEVVGEEMNKLLRTGEAFDITEAKAEAERRAVQEREASLAAVLETMRKKPKRSVDPIQFAMSICAEDLAYYSPVFAWEHDLPTVNQIRFLERAGISSGSVTCKGQASLIIDRLMKRSSAGLSTPRQIRVLEKYGYTGVGTWTKAQASDAIDTLARNGWRCAE